jgi:hypothetical protein
MPRYTVKDPASGKTIVLTGDSPPTEAELTEIFAKVNGTTESAAAPHTPAAGRGTGYNPQQSGTSALQALVDLLPMLGGTAGGMLGGAGGTVFGLGVGGVPGAIGGAAVGGAGGEAARELLNRVTGHGAPATSGDAAANIAGQAALQGGSELIGAGLTKSVGAVGKAMYRGYLKPSLRGTAIDKARDIVETGLREALPITQVGEERATRLIGEINQEVNTVLARNKGTVDLHQIAERVRGFAKRKYFGPGSPSSDYEAAMKVADEIDQHAALALPAGAKPTRVDVSLPDANATKQRLDTAIGDTAFGTERGAATEARKQGRYATRQAIEAQAPEVGSMNAREAKLIDAQDAIKHAAGREENRSALFGVPSMVAGAVTGEESARTGDPTGALVKGLLVRGALSPAVASRVAIVAARLARMSGTAPATAVRIAIQQVLSGRDEQGQNAVGK